MSQTPSDQPGVQPIIAQLTEVARAGDWDRLEALSALLPSMAPPASLSQLSEQLFQLRECLIAARTTRADLVKSLHRLTAASRFNQFG